MTDLPSPDSTSPTPDLARRAVLREAQKEDAGRLAELFRISSEGVADYVWSRFADDYPGLSLLEVGTRRYEREGTPFSYQNAIVAEHAGNVVGMLVGFVMEDSGEVPDDMDPVLRPYAELEVPGSYYIAGLALLPAFRNRGLGTRLLGAGRERARSLGASEMSLICLAQNEGARRLYEREGFAEIARRAIVPHPMIHATGEALLMVARV